MTVTNLDYLAATHAQAVISQTKRVEKSTVENAITKVLGVLQEQGVYACFVFALSRAKSDTDKSKDAQKSDNTEPKSMRVIVREMASLLKALDFEVTFKESAKTYEEDAGDTLKQVAENVTKDLERLLLAKDVLEQMLIYARYGAKARPESAEPSQPQNQGA